MKEYLSNPSAEKYPVIIQNMNREYLGTEYRTSHLNNASGTECYNDGYNLLNYEQYGRVVWQTLLLK